VVSGLPSEATRGFGRGEPLDEVGAQGFVLAMGGIGRLQEDGGEVRFLFYCAVRHTATRSCISPTVKAQALVLPRNGVPAGKYHSNQAVVAECPRTGWTITWWATVNMFRVRITQARRAAARDQPMDAVLLGTGKGMGIQASRVPQSRAVSTPKKADCHPGAKIHTSMRDTILVKSMTYKFLLR